jgi:hypothetical protein
VCTLLALSLGTSTILVGTGILAAGFLVRWAVRGARSTSTAAERK